MKHEFLRFLHLYVAFQVPTKLMHCLHYLCGFLDFRGPFSFRAYLSHFQEPCKDYLKRVRATNWGLLSPVLSIFYPYIYVHTTIQISKKENRFAIIFTKFSSCKLHRSKRIPTYAQAFLHYNIVSENLLTFFSWWNRVKICFKRLRLGKTTGWQHRFFDLTILSPIWLGTYEYMKKSL